MAIVKLTDDEIVKMRIAGKLASEVLDYITPFVKAGTSTGRLNELCHNYIVDVQKAIPAPLNYAPSGHIPYPASVCTSVNEVICHGVPSYTHLLKDGDIINIDVTVIKDGYHGDTSRMFLVGDVTDKAKKLCQVTYEALFKGIEVVKPGNYVGDIGHAIQTFIKPFGYSIVDSFCGHGIGSVFHTEPQVMHAAKPGTGPQFFAGMAFTIEPMINIGSKQGKVMLDQWTVKTRDNLLSAQWEHTILVTPTGCEILTLSESYPAFPSFFNA